jgi:hypothetical protein
MLVAFLHIKVDGICNCSAISSGILGMALPFLAR